MIGVFTTDRQLIIRTWDDWLERATLISTAGARGRELTRLFPEIVSRGTIESLDRVLQTGVVEVLAPAFHHYLIACAPLTPSRRFEKMQQRVTIAPLREEQSVVGLIVTIEDVTARIEEEREDAHSLSDEDWRNRKKAVEQLASQRTDDVVKTLLESLRDEHQNPAVLNSALQVLAISGWDVVAPLAEFLTGPDLDLRIYAALALGEQNHPKAIPHLIKALGDSNPNVKYHAIEALGKLRAQEASEPLMEIVRTRDFFLAFVAIDALAAIGDVQCSPLLIELLADEHLRGPAAETLCRLGEISVVAPLCRLLNDGGIAAPVFAAGLSSLYQRYEKEFGEGRIIADLVATEIDDRGASSLVAVLSTSTGELLRSLALVIGWLRGPEIDRAFTNLLSDRSVRTEVFDALVRHGRQVADLVIEQLQAEDLDTRQAAVAVLGRIGESKAVPYLVRALKDDPDLTVSAADALARIGDRTAYEALVELIGHEQASVRQSAVAAINSLGHPDMATRAPDLLRSPDARVRESAVRIAGYFAYPECTDRLLQLCDDPEESVQRAAIEHLPYLDDPRAADVLLSRLTSGTSKTRAAAAQALGDVEHPRIAEALRQALKDSDPWVRYYASRSIARHGAAGAAAGAIVALGELAQADSSPFVRIAAIEALGLVGIEAVKRLLPLVQSEDRDIARAALEALAKTRAADAMPSLVAAAHASDSDRRIDAATALAAYGGAESINILQWLGADRDSRVAEAAVRRLAELATPEAIKAIIGLTAEPDRREIAVAALAMLGEKHSVVADGLRHSQPEVRSAVIEAFGRMKQPRASDWIAEGLNDKDHSVRLAAVNSLARLGSMGHRKTLGRLAETDPDVKVRQAARNVVGPSTDGI